MVAPQEGADAVKKEFGGFRNFQSAVESFQFIELTRPIADRCCQLSRKLRENGPLIKANDLWIRTTALHDELPVMTGNRTPFSQVPERLGLGS